MPIYLEFLGWDRPALHTAVSLLLKRHTARDGTCDLSRVVLVTPGARSGRRLLEHLVLETEASSGSSLNLDARGAGGRPGHRVTRLLPPDVITVGELPERLYAPTLPVMGSAEAVLIRAQLLAKGGKPFLEPLGMMPGNSTAQPPGQDEAAPVPWRDWIRLAQELERLHAEVAASCLSFSDVADRCAELGIPQEAPRWRALAALQAQFEARLAALQVQDLHQARLQALEHDALESDAHFYLVCIPDLNPLMERLVERTRADITALIFAPDSERTAFNTLGTLAIDTWHGRPIPVRDAQLRVVDRPRDQASAVLATLSALHGRYAADEITVGFGDEGLAKGVERALELAGAPARSWIGNPVSLSPPALLLTAIAELLEEERPERLAALVRHPDVERWLSREAFSEESPAGGTLTRAELQKVRDWPSLLDQFTGERLPRVLPDTLQQVLTSMAPAGEGPGERPGDRPGDPASRRAGAAMAQNLALLSGLTEAIRRLLPPRALESLPLQAWSEPLRRILRTLYRHRTFQRFRQADAFQIRSLELLIAQLARWEVLGLTLAAQAGTGVSSPDSSFAEHTSPPTLQVSLTAAEAIRLLLQQLEDQSVPALEEPGSIELLGWLELALDDAPVLLVVGMNEGFVPESSAADPFLPNHLRQRLGLVDNRRRYARDALFLRQMLESRPEVRLIAGRRGAQGDPLVPSRLLFTGAPDEVAARILHFYGGEDPSDVSLVRPWIEAGGQVRFQVPPPQVSDEVLSRLKVTAFRAYLSCPYRFYLAHILRLTTLQDSAQELDAAGFGSLAHDVLCAFGTSALKDSADPKAIQRFLVEALHEQVRSRYGAALRPAVTLQTRHLEQRFDHFAQWQADQRRQGWHILAVEAPLEHTLMVDQQPFVIEGRVDRIDRHEGGTHRILDYKTPDVGKSPEQTHQAKSPEGPVWTDLQLPLYQVMASGTGLTDPGAALGYVNLSAEPGHSSMLRLAEWQPEELSGALDTAYSIIRSLRAKVFWPPRPSPWADDPFGGITFDQCVDPQSFKIESNKLEPDKRESDKREPGKGEPK